MAGQESTPQANTKVTIGGKTYELRNMSKEAGLELYRALPANYQKQADHLAQVLVTFGSVQKVAEAHGIDPTELAQEWIRNAVDSEVAHAARRGFSEAKQRAMRELDNANIDVGALVRMVPGGDGIVAAAQTANGAAKVVGVVAGTAGAAIDGSINGAPRTWNMVATLGKEGWGKIFGYGNGAPDDNARAFAAATMALRHQMVGDRHAMPMFDWNPTDTVDSQVGSNPVEYAKAGGNWLWAWIKQNIPLMEYVVGFGNWLVNAGWEKDKPTLSQYVAQARVDIEQDKVKTPANGQHFDRLADAAMWDKEGEAARKSLEAAVMIAGLDARNGRATAATMSRFTSQRTDGVDVTYENGQPTAEVTPGMRVGNAWGILVGDGSTLEQGIRGGVAVASAASVAHNGLKGFTRGAAGNTNPLPEKIMDWARKPAQVGAGEVAIRGGWGKLLNAPGTVAGWLGHVTGWATRKTAATAVGLKTVAVGSVEGVHAVVNEADTGKAATRMEAVGKGLGKVAAHTIKIVEPAVAVGKTLHSVGSGDGSGIVVHGGETGAMITTMIKVGAKRAVPVLAPIASTAELAHAAYKGDKGSMVKAGAELGTIGSFAAAGAGVGAFFGGVGAIPGAAIGATIGGIASIFTGSKAEDMYNERAKKKAAPKASPGSAPGVQAAAPQVLSPEELTVAHEEVIRQVRAQAAAKAMQADKPRIGFAFRPVHSTTIGALNPETSASVPAGEINLAATPMA